MVGTTCRSTSASEVAPVAIWTVTIRTGPRVERHRFDALEPALITLGDRVAELAGATAQRPPDTKLRRYRPEQQVAARIELSGPQRLLPTVHAGVDVKGDGTTAPYLGRVRRRGLDQSEHEDAVTALRRALPGG